MNQTVIQILGIIVAIAPIALDAITKFAAHQPVDWSLIISSIVSAIGGSQAIKRLGDTSAAHVDAKVEAKVAQVIARTIPPAAPVQE
jgi:hypothetical protein